jgi:hypothetical protein
MIQINVQEATALSPDKVKDLSRAARCVSSLYDARIGELKQKHMYRIMMLRAANTLVVVSYYIIH